MNQIKLVLFLLIPLLLLATSTPAGAEYYKVKVGCDDTVYAIIAKGSNGPKRKSKRVCNDDCYSVRYLLKEASFWRINRDWKENKYSEGIFYFAGIAQFIIPISRPTRKTVFPFGVFKQSIYRTEEAARTEVYLYCPDVPIDLSDYERDFKDEFDKITVRILISTPKDGLNMTF